MAEFQQKIQKRLIALNVSNDQIVEYEVFDASYQSNYIV